MSVRRVGIDISAGLRSIFFEILLFAVRFFWISGGGGGFSASKQVRRPKNLKFHPADACSPSRKPAPPTKIFIFHHADACSPSRNRHPPTKKLKICLADECLPSRKPAPPTKKQKNSTPSRANERKKPPAGRNLFYLAPPSLAPLAPAGLRSIFGMKKGIFLFFLNFRLAGASSPSRNRFAE